MRNGLLCWAVLATAAGSGLLATAAIADPLDDLNALRAANGLPAGIVENPAWSAGCALHMSYLALNDFEGDWHTESPSRPGYTDGRRGRRGQLGALQRAVVRAGDELGGRAVSLRAAARAEALGHRRSRTAACTRGRATCGPSRRSCGSTRTPVTASQDTTSPYLYVFGFGGGTTGGTLSEATLIGPSGAVGVRIVDNHTRGGRGPAAAGRDRDPRHAARARRDLHGAGDVHLGRGRCAPSSAGASAPA